MGGGVQGSVGGERMCPQMAKVYQRQGEGQGGGDVPGDGVDVGGVDGRDVGGAVAVQVDPVPLGFL